jgi:fermentation-respiration switch protein FrsA (DUF1100 family)
MRHFKAIILFILILYPLVAFTVGNTQSWVIFRSNGASLDPPRGLTIEELYLNTADGQKLYAWWLQSRHAQKTILFFQGNGRNLTHQRSRLKTFAKLGVNALLIDYRGYGRSSGKIVKEHDIYTDGTTAWNYLVDQKRIAPADIILWGRSLGGAVATEIADRNEVATLVLESTFFSMDDIARIKCWFLPVELFLQFHFTSGEKLKRIDCPIVIIHSTEDDYIPFAQAAKLYAAANEPKTIIKTRGSHLDLFDHSDNDVAQLRVELNL